MDYVWTGSRRVIAGLAPVERRFSPRSSDDAFWEALDASCIGDNPSDLSSGLGGKNWDSGTDTQRYRAFVRQAKDFYAALQVVSPAARPLPAYYFVLNLSKAFLTLTQPDEMRQDKIMHGVAVVKDSNGSYAFGSARSEARESGVFRLLAGCTGAGNEEPADNPIAVVDLLPYLLEATAEYSAMSNEDSRLIEVEQANVAFYQIGYSEDSSSEPDTDSPPEYAMTLELDGNLVKRRRTSDGSKLTPSQLAAEAGLFGENFEYGREEPYSGGQVSFVSIERWPEVMDGSEVRPEVLSQWRTIWDSSLIGVDRTQSGGRTFITLDQRTNLISYEAITFLMTHHLSEMVRYRPHTVDDMLKSEHAWVLTTWVQRACENFLLTMASRITGEEHRVG